MMREKGERVCVSGEGRKGGGRLLIQTESVYNPLVSALLAWKIVASKIPMLHNIFCTTHMSISYHRKPSFILHSCFFLLFNVLIFAHLHIWCKIGQTHSAMSYWIDSSKILAWISNKLDASNRWICLKIGKPMSLIYLKMRSKTH